MAPKHREHVAHQPIVCICREASSWHHEVYIPSPPQAPASNVASPHKAASPTSIAVVPHRDLKRHLTGGPPASTLPLPPTCTKHCHLAVCHECWWQRQNVGVYSWEHVIVKDKYSWWAVLGRIGLMWWSIVYIKLGVYYSRYEKEWRNYIPPHTSLFSSEYFLSYSSRSTLLIVGLSFVGCDKISIRAFVVVHHWLSQRSPRSGHRLDPKPCLVDKPRRHDNSSRRWKTLRSVLPRSFNKCGMSRLRQWSNSPRRWMD